MTEKARIIMDFLSAPTIFALNRTMSMVFLSIISRRCADSAEKVIPLQKIKKLQ